MLFTDHPIDVLSIIFRSMNTCELISLRQVSKAWREMIEQAIDSHSIYCNNKLGDDDLYILRNAKVINMRNCRQVTGKGLQHLSKVEILNLSGCHKIRDDDLKHLKNISAINLAGCYQITNAGLKHLTKANYIDLSYCPNITIAGISLYTWKPTTTLVLNKSLSNNAEINTNRHPILINNANCYQHIQIKPEEEVFKIPKIVPLSLEQSQTINDYRCKLFDQIYSTDQRDKIFIKDYCDLLPCPGLNDYSTAIRRLYQNDALIAFINNINLTDCDALIGGSTGLACVYQTASFVPGDIDLYIKEIDGDKLRAVENAIYQTFEIKNVVVVRNPITVTWYIHQKDDTVATIQVNILKITSWAELFITYHTDLTCIGYELQTGNFVYLTGRWENILHDEPHCFSNILNFDNNLGILNAATKYQSRGFNCSASTEYLKEGWKLNISDLMDEYYDIQTCDVSDSTSFSSIIAENFLPHILCKYRNVKGKLLFGSTVDHVFGDETPVPIRYLSVSQIDPNEDLTAAYNYFNCDCIQLSYGRICDTTKQLFTVGIRCPTCNYCVSLACYVAESIYKYDKKLCNHLRDSVIFCDVKYDFLPELIII